MQHRFTSGLAIAAVTAVAAMTLAGCASSGGAKMDDTTPDHVSGTVSFWHYFTDREAKIMQTVVDGFEKAYPDVKVEVHTGQSDDKIAKVISSGGDLDVGILNGTDNLGTICKSGAFRDLGPAIKRDSVDLSKYLPIPLDASSFEGKQCGLPTPFDAYGLYYNTKMLADAGYTAPPKTLSELEDMAMKLTTFNADGSIKTLGFNPLMGFYENLAAQWGPITGATWMKDGKSAIADNPAWTDLMTWQKGFVDKIGYDKLKAFSAGAGDEFSASNAFQTGQVAMLFDGEWRVAFIEDQTPDLPYATAPFPVGDKYTDLYGGGLINTPVIGISKNAKNPEAAWALIKYISMNTDAEVTLASQLKNIPTTKEALASPDMKASPQFQTFLDIAKNPSSLALPSTVIGSANQTTMDAYWDKYQSGDGGDLAAGLKKVDADINNQLSLSEGP